MKKLETFLENPFTGQRISLDNKKKFGESHLANLAANNSGNVYDQAISDTTTVQINLFGDITNVALNKALQKSQTQSVDGLIEKFSKRNTRLNNYLISTEVNQQPVYQSFFPQGVMEFTSKVTKGNVEQLMKRMVDVITLNTAAAGGEDVLAEYETFRTQYAATRGMQLTKIGEVSSGISSREAAEEAWDNQLFDNLLLIARENKGKPELVNNFFDQSIIRSNTNSDSDGKGRLTGIIKDSDTQMPLKNAQVHIVDGQINKASTNADGRYSTQSVATGSYMVQISCAGYISQEITVDIEDEGDTALDVLMVKA
ncbi:MAG: carboxypeptidase-like regulatory domain-containing protein [Daejeonella sp.]